MKINNIDVNILAFSEVNGIKATFEFEGETYNIDLDPASIQNKINSMKPQELPSPVKEVENKNAFLNDTEFFEFMKQNITEFKTNINILNEVLESELKVQIENIKQRKQQGGAESYNEVFDKIKNLLDQNNSEISVLQENILTDAIILDKDELTNTIPTLKQDFDSNIENLNKRLDELDTNEKEEVEKLTIDDKTKYDSLQSELIDINEKLSINKEKLDQINEHKNIINNQILNNIDKYNQDLNINEISIENLKEEIENIEKDIQYTTKESIIAVSSLIIHNKDEEAIEDDMGFHDTENDDDPFDIHDSDNDNKKNTYKIKIHLNALYNNKSNKLIELKHLQEDVQTDIKELIENENTNLKTIFNMIIDNFDTNIENKNEKDITVVIKQIIDNLTENNSTLNEKIIDINKQLIDILENIHKEKVEKRGQVKLLKDKLELLDKIVSYCKLHNRFYTISEQYNAITGYNTDVASTKNFNDIDLNELITIIKGINYQLIYSLLIKTNTDFKLLSKKLEKCNKNINTIIESNFEEPDKDDRTIYNEHIKFVVDIIDKLQHEIKFTVKSGMFHTKIEKIGICYIQEEWNEHVKNNFDIENIYVNENNEFFYSDFQENLIKIIQKINDNIELINNRIDNINNIDKETQLIKLEIDKSLLNNENLLNCSLNFDDIIKNIKENQQNNIKFLNKLFGKKQFGQTLFGKSFENKALDERILIVSNELKRISNKITDDKLNKITITKPDDYFKYVKELYYSGTTGKQGIIYNLFKTQEKLISINPNYKEETWFNKDDGLKIILDETVNKINSFINKTNEQLFLTPLEFENMTLLTFDEKYNVKYELDLFKNITNNNYKLFKEKVKADHDEEVKQKKEQHEAEVKLKKEQREEEAKKERIEKVGESSYEAEDIIQQSKFMGKIQGSDIKNLQLFKDEKIKINNNIINPVNELLSVLDETEDIINNILNNTDEEQNKNLFLEKYNYIKGNIKNIKTQVDKAIKHLSNLKYSNDDNKKQILDILTNISKSTENIMSKPENINKIKLANEQKIKHETKKEKNTKSHMRMGGPSASSLSSIASAFRLFGGKNNQTMKKNKVRHNITSKIPSK